MLKSIFLDITNTLFYNYTINQIIYEENIFYINTIIFIDIIDSFYKINDFLDILKEYKKTTYSDEIEKIELEKKITETEISLFSKAMSIIYKRETYLLFTSNIIIIIINLIFGV